ncbi:MAG TPA: EamA family transporter, partial [Planctomycetia bacterium]|nr:EamA family transporter [Planctomycetia bacterium]
MTSPLASRWTAIAVLTFVNMLWGCSFPLMKSLLLFIEDRYPGADEVALRGAGTAFLLALRFTLALGLFAIVFRANFRAATAKEWGAGALVGVAFSIGMLLQVYGLGLIPASRSGFLTSMCVVFVPIATALVHGRLPNLPTILGVCAAVVGVTILSGVLVWTPRGPAFASDSTSGWTFGDTLTLAGTLLFTIQIMAIDGFGKRLRPACLTPGSFAVTAAVGWIAFAATLCLA